MGFIGLFSQFSPDCFGGPCTEIYRKQLNLLELSTLCASLSQSMMGRLVFFVICFLLGVHGITAHRERQHLKSRVVVDEAAIDRLEAHLFPNRTAAEYTHGRGLAIKKAPYVEDDVKCSFCPTTMKYCSILSNKMIQEKYLPKNTNVKETCKVFESLGKRMSDEVFGPGRTFRDTPHCRG